MGDIWTYVPPTVISTIISTSVGYYLSRRTAKKAEWSTRLEELCKDIRAQSDDVRKYWSSALSSQELMALTITIKARFLDISEQMTDLRLSYGVREFESDYLTRLLDESLEQSTGGDFESAGRAIDGSRAIAASERLNELRRELFACKHRAL